MTGKREPGMVSTVVRLPASLVSEVRGFVGERGLSMFVRQAMRNEILRREERARAEAALRELERQARDEVIAAQIEKARQVVPLSDEVRLLRVLRKVGVMTRADLLREIKWPDGRLRAAERGLSDRGLIWYGDDGIHAMEDW